jgi:hypothetical protein
VSDDVPTADQLFAEITEAHPGRHFPEAELQHFCEVWVEARRKVALVRSSRTGSLAMGHIEAATDAMNEAFQLGEALHLGL